ncbi:twin-arginine translocation signal domain-containing protein [Halobacterium hubeiense]|uniref:twin-arginine translocation signal domain-containing protein n=1 Tax=Halobacterium hubeiense TaxID=1407499 RepID=UPI003C75F9A6
MGRVNRRRFLVGLGAAAVTGVGALIPNARDAATLDAKLEIQDWARDGEDHIDAIEFWMLNQQTGRGSPQETAINPVVIPWGRGSQAQQDWPIVDGPDQLPAGESAIYRVHSPHTELRLGQTALLTVYDKGTEQRAWTRFTPSTEGGDGD